LPQLLLCLEQKTETYCEPVESKVFLISLHNLCSVCKCILVVTQIQLDTDSWYICTIGVSVPLMLIGLKHLSSYTFISQCCIEFLNKALAVMSDAPSSHELIPASVVMFPLRSSLMAFGGSSPPWTVALFLTFHAPLISILITNN
jgi:hypothetical protein